MEFFWSFCLYLPMLGSQVYTNLPSFRTSYMVATHSTRLTRMSPALLNTLPGSHSTGTGYWKQYLPLGQTFLENVTVLHRLSPSEVTKARATFLVNKSPYYWTGLALPFAGSRCSLPLRSLATQTAQQQELSEEFEWHPSQQPMTTCHNVTLALVWQTGNVVA